MKRAVPESSDHAAVTSAEATALTAVGVESSGNEGFVNGNCSGGKRVKGDGNCVIDGVIVYTRKSKLKARVVESSGGVKIGGDGGGRSGGDVAEKRKPFCWWRAGESRMINVPIEDEKGVELAKIKRKGDRKLFFARDLDVGNGSGGGGASVVRSGRFKRMMRVGDETVDGVVGFRREVVRDMDVVQKEVVGGSVDEREEVVGNLAIVPKVVAVGDSVGIREEIMGDLSNAEEGGIGQSSNLQLSVIGESSRGGETDREVGSLDEVAMAEVGASGTPQRNLELKMSKKIVLDTKPTTVRELLETGLLEGLTVIYMGVKKSVGFGLRGTIKDDGIMCWCSLCRGRNIISISQFEIHACNTYKRASQYICFENGKSLLDVLNACRDAPLHMLEATVQSTISCSSDEKYFNCRRCKGSFVASSFANESLMCNSCLEVRDPRSNHVSRTRRRIRFSKSIWISKSSRSSLARNSFMNKRTRKLKLKGQRAQNYMYGNGRSAAGTEGAYDAHGKKVVEGYEAGFGIICYHCNHEVSHSQSEAHADGEQLMHCDGCPRVFHKECASLLGIPHGAQYCKLCENVFQREKSEEHNIDIPGRISGAHLMEQITQRCVRVVDSTEPEVNGCVLCSCHDFSTAGFGPRTIIICDQCEQEYHVGCLREHKIAKLKEIPKGKWFCCIDCKRIHSTLSKLLIREAERIPDPLRTIVMKRENPGLDYVNGIDLRWKLLSGNIATSDSSVWLAETVAMFQENFDPIVDPVTGRDLIPSIVHGKNTSGQQFGGLYCATLLVNSSVVSAGIIRIFGCEVAELPLVATRKAYHHKGYFTLLFACIERLLTFLNVRFVVLPVAEEADSIWIEKFGFTKLNPDEVTNFRKRFWPMVTFTGTIMLQRMVSGHDLISEPSCYRVL